MSEGKLAFKIDQVKKLVERIDKAHAESSDNTLKPSMDNHE
jgi:hypothetical protein